MIPYYQQPRLQTQRQPQQSQGFQPTQLRPRPQQTLYAQTGQPPAAAFSQPYQSYPQYRQSGPAQYFTQQPSQPFAPQRRYAPQSGPQSAPQPHPVAMHQASAPYRPSQPSQLHNAQAHVQSYSSTPSFSYPQPRSGPVIPPTRANSQSPDKGRRPLPDPSATSGVTRQRPTSMPPTSTPVPGVQVQSQSAYPPASSVPQMPMPSSQTQPFHNQSQHQPPRAPLQSYEPALHTRTIPNSVQSAQASSTHTVESTTSKRPLPAPPGKAAPSPSSQPVTPSHSKMSPAATPAASRTLPFSPTQSPSVFQGMKARTGSFSSSAQSSSLSTVSDDTISERSSGTAKNRHDAAEGPVIRISRQTVSPPAPNSQPSSFSSPPAQPASAAPTSTSRLPPREQGSKSLAFRLASLSLREEQTHKQPAKRPLPVGNRTPFKSNSASPLARSHRRSAMDLDDIPPPPPPIRLQSFEQPSIVRSRPTVPTIILPGEDDDDEEDDDDDDDDDEEEEEDDDDDDDENENVALQTSANGLTERRRGLICYGCDRGIIGRIVSAMGGRWHPACFKCMICGELLEHVSSYEHDGQPYCHLDYHEKFAPQCYHCRTPIVDERFITLDDPALGKRTYHEQHFFCAECGDPFLAPTIPGKKRDIGPEGEVVSPEDDVGFTVFKGHPYCQACHVRLRYPKCKRCKKSIRDGMQAVEALGGKWCWECFLCAGCEKPFDDPAFFQRDNKAYCEPCFSLIIRNEI